MSVSLNNFPLKQGLRLFKDSFGGTFVLHSLNNFPLKQGLRRYPFSEFPELFE